uniref:Uncharacterized protein n=1 Tax=Wuchereria bancrofti TaxID=6293 RepID=A0A1I8EPR7_WUCBA
MEIIISKYDFQKIAELKSTTQIVLMSTINGIDQLRYNAKMDLIQSINGNKKAKNICHSNWLLYQL